MSNQQAIEVELAQDVEYGPLANVMLSYTLEEVDLYIHKECPDPRRSAIIGASDDELKKIKEAVNPLGASVIESRESIKEKIEQYHSIMKGINSKSDRPLIGKQPDWIESEQRLMAQNKGEFAAHAGGGAFVDLATIAITYGFTSAAGAKVSIELIKALKAVIAQWLAGRDKRTVTIKIDKISITVKGPVNDKKLREIDDVLRQRTRT